MNRTPTIKFTVTDIKAAIALALFALAFVTLTLLQDVLRSNLKNSAFYFSESLMYSCFWCFFAPLLFAQYLAIKYKKSNQSLLFYLPVIALPMLIHLFAFPLLVQALSGTFYYHRFSFQQVLRFTLSEHIYLLFLLYSMPLITLHFFYKKVQLAAIPFKITAEHVTAPFIKSIIVADGNKKHSILVSDILYFSANPPYINLFVENKKYLHNQTLKSISIKLDAEVFIRIHKSTIVNINKVAAYSTRLNGDYDLTLTNHVQLRVSRNFAPGFKNLYNKTHQLTAK